jgi:hypothetical protein
MRRCYSTVPMLITCADATLQQPLPTPAPVIQARLNHHLWYAAGRPPPSRNLALYRCLSNGLPLAYVGGVESHRHYR